MLFPIIMIIYFRDRLLSISWSLLYIFETERDEIRHTLTDSYNDLMVYGNLSLLATSDESSRFFVRSLHLTSSPYTLVTYRLIWIVYHKSLCAI